jgi:hypothetical protein
MIEQKLTETEKKMIGLVHADRLEVGRFAVDFTLALLVGLTLVLFLFAGSALASDKPDAPTAKPATSADLRFRAPSPAPRIAFPKVPVENELRHRIRFPKILHIPVPLHVDPVRNPRPKVK